MQSELRILGEHPFAKDEQGRLKSRIATLFPHGRTLVTLPGIHATQRLAYVDAINRDRADAGQPPLGAAEFSEVWNRAVDLVVEDGAILIRPDPENMPLAFKGDEVLQELVPKHRVKFLYVLNDKVREAIKRRGECWRVNPLPKSAEEMQAMIAASRIGIGGQDIYYYNRLSGTRFLTYQQFAGLPALGEEEFRRHLAEIREFSARANPQGNPELSFFMAGGALMAADFAPYDFAALEPAEVAAAFDALRKKFFAAVAPEFRQDDPRDPNWRNRMYVTLIGREGDAVPEEVLLGLGAEFFMQVEWLPGGRIDEGELIMDSVFEEHSAYPDDPELRRLCDEKSQKFIFNFVREFGDLEYVNLGRVIGSLSHRQASLGRRDVYLAEIKQRDRDKELLKIIRLQKWGVREHLDDGKPLLDAIIESEEYTEYTLDRRLGCRQLGMNLPMHVTAHRIGERYTGHRRDLYGVQIWSPYFERDYIHGMATDKIPGYRYQQPAFALGVARLLGRAAAPNMIVGRSNLRGKVLFDDGDEVLILDEAGLPADLIVADLTGTFNNYRQELQAFAAVYAAAVNNRVPHLPDPKRFAELYLENFVERFLSIQQEYRRRRRAFDTLFKHRRRDPGGSFAFRWEKVLERLDRADAQELARIIAQNLVLEKPQPQP